ELLLRGLRGGDQGRGLRRPVPGRRARPERDARLRQERRARLQLTAARLYKLARGRSPGPSRSEKFMGDLFWSHVPALLDGLANSLLVSVIGIALAVLIGIVLGAARN